MDRVLQRSIPGYEIKHVVFGCALAIGVALLATAAVKIADFIGPTVSLKMLPSHELPGLLRKIPYEGGSGSHETVAGFRGGFIDRDKIHIIPDRPVVNEQSTPVIYTSEQDYIPAITNPDPGIGEGTGSGIGNGDLDFGLPEPAVLASVLKPSLPEPTFPEQKLKLKKPKPDHEVIIRFQPDEPRYPYKAGNIKGEATARFIVDEHGNIRDVKIVHESPERSGFGTALQKAFADVSYVDAAVVNGQSIACTYFMTYYFGTGNVKPKVVASRNMTVILPR